MKTTLVSMVLLMGCQLSGGDTVRSFIPGTYVKTINQEFSTGNDTLFISLISNPGNNYQIVRHTSYRRIIDGKVLPVENEMEKSTGIYNRIDKVLNETREGSIISFSPDKNELYVGAAMYRKVTR